MHTFLACCECVSVIHRPGVNILYDPSIFSVSNGVICCMLFTLWLIPSLRIFADICDHVFCVSGFGAVHFYQSAFSSLLTYVLLFPLTSLTLVDLRRILCLGYARYRFLDFDRSSRVFDFRCHLYPALVVSRVRPTLVFIS